MWSAPAWVPAITVGWKETVDRDDGVVPSTVFVRVESVSPWQIVWIIFLGHVVLGVMASIPGGLVVGVGWSVVVMECMMRPLSWRELRVVSLDAS